MSSIRRQGARLWLATLLLLVSVAPQAEGLAPAALLEALRGGGHTLYFRHEATDWSQSDQVRQRGDWLSCDGERMRQLSAAGRAEARATGAAMRRLGVPVGRVLASPYCRTMQTARELGLGEVEASTDIMNLRAASYFGGDAAVIARARRLIAQPPAAGTNTVLVAHGNVGRAATGVYPGEGEALVFAPEGDGFRFVGRLSAAQWQALDR